GLRVARAQHRHQLAPRTVRAVAQPAGESVELADRALKVLLSDLVVGCRHHTRIGRTRCLSLRLHQDLRPVARRTRRSRLARRAAPGIAFVWRNFNACTKRRLAGLRMMSASRRDSRNSSGPLKSRMRIRTDPSPWGTWASEPAPPG